MKLDNPLLVRWEYASEERLVKRNSIFRTLIEGDNPEDVAFDAVAEARPQRLLDVGCGPGEVTQRFDELGARVCAVDTSERMVELAKGRGLDAQVELWALIDDGTEPRESLSFSSIAEKPR